MLSNYFAAAIRNFRRNGVYSVIVTLSLALGLAAMMLALIYWRYEHTYDRFWPNQDRIYLVNQKNIWPNGRTDFYGPEESAVPLIAQGAPEVEFITQVRAEFLRLTTNPSGQRYSVLAADSNFFELFKPKLIAGDLTGALRPGSVVVTRAMAEKYFGGTDVVGQTVALESLDGKPLAAPAQVSAVIEDWPANSHLNAHILLGASEALAYLPDQESNTYVRVRQGVTEESFRRSLQTLSKQPSPIKSYKGELAAARLEPTPLRFLYMTPKTYGPPNLLTSKRGNEFLSISLVCLGALMLSVAAINFINLMTARGAGRAVEVGVRKVVGARRLDLVGQFVGEGLLYTGFAFLLALVLVEVLIPLIASITKADLTFDYQQYLGLVAVFALGAALVGVLASLYPALVLSNIRPIQAMRGGLATIGGSPRLRQILVSLQFVPLLVLATGAFAIQADQRHQFNASLKMQPPNALLVRETCGPALKDQLAAIPGVASVGCLEVGTFRGSTDSSGTFREVGISAGLEPVNRRSLKQQFELYRTDREGLEFYGLRPLAGKIWAGSADERGLILNKAAAKALGFTPQSAIGQLVALKGYETPQALDYPVIAVINNPGGVEKAEALGYLPAPPASERKNLIAGVRFSDGADLTAATAAIDKAFEATNGRAPHRAFYRDEFFEALKEQRNLLRMLTTGVGIGLMVAVAGLFAMAVFLANLRTREVGVRKAFGASRFNLLGFMIFQFTRPVLVANLVAICIVIATTVWASRSQPMDQRALGYTLAGAAVVVVGSLAITFLATFAQAWRVTGKLPLQALRSE